MSERLRPESMRCKMAENNSHTFVIAEAGVNHNGCVGRALDLVAVAFEAGADAVKFQTFDAEALASEDAPKAAYQEKTTGTDDSQLAMLKGLELSKEDHFVVKDKCDALGIEFMSTPFDIGSCDFLVEHMGVRRLKIASGEITNAPLLLRISRAGLPMVLSTGMATLDEIEAALGVIAFGLLGLPDEEAGVGSFKEAYNSKNGSALLLQHVTLLQCTTEYPAPPETINLRAMDALLGFFSLPTGLSDHSEGILLPIAAVGRGAVMIEKHFTLDKSLPGPDHGASLEPAELKEMVAGIRLVQKALGSGMKEPNTREINTRLAARKSLVALVDISEGEQFTFSNLGAKRPGGGVSPLKYWEYSGRVASRSYSANDLIDPI